MSSSLLNLVLIKFFQQYPLIITMYTTSKALYSTLIYYDRKCINR